MHLQQQTNRTKSKCDLGRYAHRSEALYTPEFLKGVEGLTNSLKGSFMNQESCNKHPQANNLANIVKWKDYVHSHSNIWATEHSARHFLNTRKEQMIAIGALFKSTSGWMVDHVLLDQNLYPLLISVSPEQLKLPLESDDGEVSK